MKVDIIGPLWFLFGLAFASAWWAAAVFGPAIPDLWFIPVALTFCLVVGAAVYLVAEYATW